jgi:membrane protein DedA with SNARE-associated domain
MVLLGTFLEGETALILGVFAAYGGFLELPLVLSSAFCGGFCGDLMYFYLGRRHGSALLSRYPQWETRVRRMRELLHRYHIPAILTVRFMYGIRTAALVALGLSTVPTRRFIVLSAASVTLWTTVIGIASFVLGEALASLPELMKHLQFDVMGGIVIAIITLWTVRTVRRHLPLNQKPLRNAGRRY